MAKAKRHETLAELRTCLFFEQRRWRHYGENPDEVALSEIRKLVDAIRERVISLS